MQYWLTGDLSSPAFRELDLETLKSLWKARKFIVGTPLFRKSLRRSIIATSKIIEAGGPLLKPIIEKIHEMKLLTANPRGSTAHPRLWLEDEAAAYAASRLRFALPEGEKEGFPAGETGRLSFLP